MRSLTYTEAIQLHDDAAGSFCYISQGLNRTILQIDAPFCRNIYMSQKEARDFDWEREAPAEVAA